MAALMLLAACSTGASENPPSTNPEVSVSQSVATPAPDPTPAPTPSPTPEPTPEPTPTPIPVYTAKLQFGGDILLHTNSMKGALQGDGTYDFTNHFADFVPYVNGDFTCCNLESNIDVYGGNKDLSTYPRFNLCYELIPGIQGLGIDLVTNANNHSVDKGFSGLVATLDNLDKAGLPHLGTYRNKEEHDKYTIIDVKGIKVGILAYTDSLNGLNSLLSAEQKTFAVNTFNGLSTDDVPRMIEDMDKCRAAGAEIIVMVLHWGVEYRDAPRDAQVDIATALCAGGCDLLIGGHPHAVEPAMWMEGKDGKKSVCYYSLGNFFVDQNALNPQIPKTQYGMYAEITVQKVGDEVTILEAGYRPTFCLRYKNSASRNGWGYRLLNAGSYLEPDADGTRPDIFVSDADWKKCIEAFEHVTKIGTDNLTIYN
jgi:poly-gamma-glutamate synthesis protein (capsule biosynthesis protein)